MTRTIFAFCLVAAFLATACASGPVPRRTHERLHSTLYLQQSAEYPASCLQAYRTATERLEAALKDPTWTAEPDQTGDIAALPPAVIIDVDETVLDNSPYYALMIQKNSDFDLKQWNRWVVTAQAELTAGAAQFIAAAQKAGVAVYFVTNRDFRSEGFTRLNLQRRGITLDPQTDTLLMLNERLEWKADKRARRAFIAQTHRILLDIGDNLHDFVSIEGLDERARKQLIAEKAAYWGTRWFMIPNPGYGNWIDAIEKDSRIDLEQLERKYAALRPAAEISDEMMLELMKTPLPDFPRQKATEQITIVTAKPPASPQTPLEPAPPAAPATTPTAE
jgi:acid phosphatase